MHVGEPVRPPPRVWRKAPEPPESLEDRNPEEKKVKTRIPVSRFKTAVDKVQRERKESEGERKSKKQAPEKPPRRSSIPKLSDRILAYRTNAYKTHADEQTDKTNVASKNRAKDPSRNSNGVSENDNISIDSEVKEVNVDGSENFNDEKTHNNEQLEEEFDKLYEEIVDKDVEVIPDVILGSKVKDPEKLEMKFEEIVHQYDEEVKVEPSDKARYSKIPLLKRRSEQDIKVPKQERRLSLKTSNVTKLEKTKLVESIKNDTVKINVKKQEVSENRVEDEERDHLLEINNNNNDHNNETTKNSDNKDDIIEQQHSLTLINDVMPTPDTELVKVGISHLDIAFEKHDNDEIEIKVSTLDESIENHAIPVDNKLELEEIIQGKNTEKPVINEEAITLVENPEIQETTDKIIVIDNEILSENKASEDNSVIINHNDTIEVDIINFDDNNEFKSVKLLKSVNSVEERTKSRFINKPLKKENDINVTEKEENQIVEGKVNRILIRLNSQENTNNDANETNNQIDEKAKKVELPAKGNVSKILNRITSQDIENNVKREFDEIPKKRSVLSKIALFERPDLEPVIRKKPIQKFAKPQRTTSEEIKHSPKIVHEVLKPSIRNGQTDKHEVVTIDILQPVEVVTNIEEEVIVVEDLKEQAIVFENLDEPKAEIIAIETEPSGEENKDPNALTTNDMTHAEIPVEHDTIDNRFYAKDPKVDNWKHKEVVENYVPVKEKINRLLSHEENNMKRAKSTAELDLGDAVKGKVKNMIYRMNSFELLDENVDNKHKEAISVKERPRKKSVSEKIALFEKKLTPVKMEAVDAARGLDIDAKPSDNALNTDSALDEEYNAKIKALINAKLTYGSVSSTNITYMELADGSQMPVLALGTALLDPRLAKHIVAAAIDLGFRAIDTAYIYGNEKEVGEGIRSKIQDGTVKREDLFIMSKLWSTFHQPELVEPACRASLRALGLDYVDLYMIHNPMSFKEGGDPIPKIANVVQFSSHDYLDAWFSMERLVPRFARRLGVSNFNSTQLARVLDKGRVAPVINQVECHPYLNQKRLSDFCNERGVKLSCFGVLGSKGTPSELKSSQVAAIDDPLVKVMASGLGISSAQLLISYQLQYGHGVVVKGSSPDHLWNNLQAVGVALAPAQVEALHALNRNKRTFTFKGMGDTHRNYPFKAPF